MGLFSFIKEAGEKLFGIGEAKAAEEVAKKDPTPVNVEAANKAAAKAIADYEMCIRDSMIGAPPGYVGYEEGGTLTEAVRRKPYSVILLDEVEKAHPDVFNVLLQVLDDGRLTDGQGRTVDFKNTVIIMTSNLGSQMIQSMSDQDYQVVKLAVMGEVKTHFRPEFVNRIDEVVVFHALGEANIKSIASIQLQYLAKRLAAMDMQLKVTDAALAEIASAGFDPVYGCLLYTSRCV